MRNDTIIVFLSDHGDMLFDHHMTGERCFYEGSAHITLAPGAELELFIDNTEPQNRVRLSGASIVCELQRCDPLPKKENGYALLADDEVCRIRGERKAIEFR